MTKVFRSADEQELLSLRNLERRVANLERSGAGLAIVTNTLAGDFTVTSIASPGTATGITATVVRPGLYLPILTTYVNTTAVGGWLFCQCKLLKNGVDTTLVRAITPEIAAVARDHTETFVAAPTKLAAGDVMSINAYKGAAVSTVLLIAAVTRMTLIRTGPA